MHIKKLSENTKSKYLKDIGITYKLKFSLTI